MLNVLRRESLDIIPGNPEQRYWLYSMKVVFSNSKPTLYMVSPRWNRVDSLLNWLGFSMNEIQGWTTVRKVYSRALSKDL